MNDFIFMSNFFIELKTIQVYKSHTHTHTHTHIYIYVTSNRKFLIFMSNELFSIENEECNINKL